MCVWLVAVIVLTMLVLTLLVVSPLHCLCACVCGWLEC